MNTNMKNTELTLSTINDFKNRGQSVVHPDLEEIWNSAVDHYLTDKEKEWYNSAFIEASLQCMERLSKGFSLKESYKPIDVQNDEKPAVHCNMILTKEQNKIATDIVCGFHGRGLEFRDYRNKYVGNKEAEQKVMKKSIQKDR